jgi:Na+-driven multidrug efflux pump
MTIGYVLLAIVFVSANYLVGLFTQDEHIAAITLPAIRIVLSFFPFMIIEVITVAYFQSIGKPQTAFLLTLLRNVVLLIPLLYILPSFLGYDGILYTFPIVDIITTITAFWLLRNELSGKLVQRAGTPL